MANLTFKANLLPNSNLGYNLGSTTTQWNIYGNLTGTASYAIKANEATKISNISNDTNKFLRGDNTWSNILSGPANTLLTLSCTDDTTAYNKPMMVLNPSLTSGHYLVYGIGAANSKYNLGQLCYYHYDTGSEKNALSFGIHSQDNILNITAAGNVGIGTLTPSYKLHVNGTTYINNKLYVNASFDDSSGAIQATDTSSATWRYAFQGSSPNQTAGQNTCLSLGKTINTGNCACIYHKWEGTSSVNNYMGIEFHGHGTKWKTYLDGRTITTKVGINATDLSTYHLNVGGKQKITASITDGTNAGAIYMDLSRSSGTYLRGISMMCSNMTQGTRLLYCTGYADSKYNMGQIYFYFDAAGSGSNRLSLGMHSTDDVINIIAGTGNVGIATVSPSYKLHINGNAYSTAMYGAVWNDYAEMRNVPIANEFIHSEDEKIHNIKLAGRCVTELGDGTMQLTTSRLQRGCKVISDTFGFLIGETDTCKTPIAVSGRALVYLLESREIAAQYIGWPVCSGPDGTVSIMSEEEEEKYPSRIVGTISEIPDYEIWGTGNVKVDGRIWIYVR